MNQERFDQLIQEWQRVACIHSFPWTIMRGTAYEELRAAGLSIVPMLTEQLKTDPWIAYSWLLREITGKDIHVGKEKDGWRQTDVQKTAQAWIDAAEKGNI